MIATNGHPHGDGQRAAVPDTRPVILLRARPGTATETARVVHLAPLPPGGTGAVSALCGALLCPDECETVPAGHGMPCSGCLLSHTRRSHPSPTASGRTGPAEPAEDPAHPATSPAAATRTYQELGWPATLRDGQVWLTLGGQVVALLLPVQMAATVTATLAHRHCLPALLAHPSTPDHRVLLCGEPYGVPLPWPPGVHRITGPLLLPPTPTPHGQLGWLHPPASDTLRTCREIDVIAAIRATRHNP